MPAKRFPLPKRINIALSDKAYENLRALNEKYNYGNNYLLTIVLENFEEITDSEAVDRVFAEFVYEFLAEPRRLFFPLILQLFFAGASSVARVRQLDGKLKPGSNQGTRLNTTLNGRSREQEEDQDRTDLRSFSKHAPPVF